MNVLKNKPLWTLCFLFILVGCNKSAATPTANQGLVATMTATATVLAAPVAQPTTTYLPTITRGPVFRTITPTELSGYVPNPEMGWQNTRNATPRFTETVRYTRFNWRDLNPAEGVYDWSPIEILRQEALDAGQKIHFRVRNAQPPPWGPGQVIPDWVVAQGAVIVDGSRGTEPLYADCQFLAAHAAFVDALRQQYDGNPDIAFLDIGAYGKFGEWDSEQYDHTPDSLDWHARRRLADMYLGGQGTRPCQQADGSIINVSYNYVGFQKTQLLMPYTPWREDSLFYALSVRSDIGIRHDALGSELHQNRYREKISDLVEQTWRNAPIVFEFSSDAYTPEALASARAFAQEMHATLIHDNFGGRGADADIESVLETVGFRLVLQEITYTSERLPNSSLSLTMTWINKGVAPPYTNYPLTAALIDDRGNVVWEQEITADIRAWLPQEPVIIQSEAALPALPPAVYDLRLAFVDPDTRQPVLNLAIEGRDSNGRYQIGPVQIGQ